MKKLIIILFIILCAVAYMNAQSTIADGNESVEITDGGKTNSINKSNVADIYLWQGMVAISFKSGTADMVLDYTKFTGMTSASQFLDYMTTIIRSKYTIKMTYTAGGLNDSIFFITPNPVDTPYYVDQTYDGSGNITQIKYNN